MRRWLKLIPAVAILVLVALLVLSGIDPAALFMT